MTDVEEVIRRVDNLKEEQSVPSNVQHVLETFIAELSDSSTELSVRVNTGASLLDQVSSDPNLPQHIRTEIWNIASKLESVDG